MHTPPCTHIINRYITHIFIDLCGIRVLLNSEHLQCLQNLHVCPASSWSTLVAAFLSSGRHSPETCLPPQKAYSVPAGYRLVEPGQSILCSREKASRILTSHAPCKPGPLSHSLSGSSTWWRQSHKAPLLASLLRPASSSLGKQTPYS